RQDIHRSGWGSVFFHSTSSIVNATPSERIDHRFSHREDYWSSSCFQFQKRGQLFIRRVLGTHSLPIAYHDEHLCFDLLEFLFRITLECRPHLFDLLHRNRPMGRVRRRLSVRVLQLGRGEVRRKAQILPVKFWLARVLWRPGGRTENGYFAGKFRVADRNSEGDCTSHTVTEEIRRFDL